MKNEPLEIKDLFTLSQLPAPTCGRSDCDPDENPEHWVGVHAGPVLLALIAAVNTVLKKSYLRRRGNDHDKFEDFHTHPDVMEQLRQAALPFADVNTETAKQPHEVQS
jgi:hypothetical protein